MKTILKLSLCLMIALSSGVTAQDRPAGEKFGNTLNLGAGIGYYGYIGHPLVVGNLNYEFDIARNFTLAPFAGVYSYQDDYYWGSPDLPYRYYTYRETTVPIGLKGTYYFDELFRAHSKWDFYVGTSAGFLLRKIEWENGYNGDRYVRERSNLFYVDGHIGSEFHMTPKAGIFLDLSTGVSTFGLAVHF